MSGEQMGGGRFWFGLLLVLVLVLILIAGTGGDGTPYDPRSYEPNGTRGIVEVVERLGGSVDIESSVPGDSVDTAVVFRDRLSTRDREAVGAWVESGGTLVVADPFSPFIAREPSLLTQGFELTIRPDQCSIDALALAGEVPVENALRFEVQPDDGSCFGDGVEAFIVTLTVGQGEVVLVGGQELFTNERLDDDDAATVAVNVIAPDPDGIQVGVLAPSVLVDEEPQSVTELISARVQNAVFMAAAAFLLYALYRARRLGAVVDEPLPVPIRSSELVLRSGHLEHRAGDASSSAAVLRGDLLGRLRTSLRLAIPATATSADESALDELAAHPEIGAHASRADLHVAFTAAVTGDDQLVTVAQALAELDREVFGRAQEATAPPQNQRQETRPDEPAPHVPEPETVT